MTINRISEVAKQGAKGWDTVQVITPKLAEALAKDYDYGVRYLGTVNSDEVDVILGAGMACMAVTYGIKHGTQLSAALGTGFGASSAGQAQKAGFQKGNTIFVDVEDCTGSPQDCIDFISAWATPIRAAGFIPSMYDGFGIPLTPEQLGALPVNRYWHSCSHVAVPIHNGRPIGFCMQQLYKPNIRHSSGILIDQNFIQCDFWDRLPVWTRAVG